MRGILMDIILIAKVSLDYCPLISIQSRINVDPELTTLGFTRSLLEK